MAALVPEMPNELESAVGQVQAASNIGQLKTAIANMAKATRRLKKRQDRLISEVKSLKRQLKQVK